MAGTPEDLFLKLEEKELRRYVPGDAAAYKSILEKQKRGESIGCGGRLIGASAVIAASTSLRDSQFWTPYSASTASIKVPSDFDLNVPAIAIQKISPTPTTPVKRMLVMGLEKSDDALLCANAGCCNGIEPDHICAMSPIPSPPNSSTFHRRNQSTQLPSTTTTVTPSKPSKTVKFTSARHVSFASEVEIQFCATCLDSTTTTSSPPHHPSKPLQHPMEPAGHPGDGFAGAMGRMRSVGGELNSPESRGVSSRGGESNSVFACIVGVFAVCFGRGDGIDEIVDDDATLVTTPLLGTPQVSYGSVHAAADGEESKNGGGGHFEGLFESDEDSEDDVWLKGGSPNALKWSDDESSDDDFLF
ncbi:hypothetical protein BCR33DRAFT_715000 [Rhizoclosmatium globosum]|uniref:Uncharacterized protein n=1 Tax=Rhizoclosmatium globosum TaxID=329046 RepID=A0A1Y2CJQ8_9FUNG|nr:hypothetical protein BCR33DRAFT_715000 [Rhizoclosmatium globosum]|eukprot:ORY47240.1 hypothetical protein BCR33DRAFT_715000 [Rhizoclosmatium globosum]